MRFVSKSAKYRVIVQGDQYMVLQNGERQQIRKPLVADFNDRTLTSDEVEFGIKNFVHRGLPMDPGTEEDLSPRPRISGFDTELAQNEHGWTDEEREMVEEKLLSSHALNVEFMLLVPDPAAKPWPTYDALTDVDEIVSIAVATGTVDAALAYERENRNSAAVLEALEEAHAGGEEAEAPVVIEA